VSASASIILHQKLSEKLREKAEESDSLPDELAGEILWGATALAIKMVAAKRGLKLEQHCGLWVFINTLAKESGNVDIVAFFGVANALHRNFYENEMPEETVNISTDNNNKY
jgi:hypothetical protein